MINGRYAFSDLITRCVLAALGTGASSAVLLALIVVLLAG